MCKRQGSRVGERLSIRLVSRVGGARGALVDSFEFIVQLFKFVSCRRARLVNMKELDRVHLSHSCVPFLLLLLLLLFDLTLLTVARRPSCDNDRQESTQHKPTTTPLTSTQLRLGLTCLLARH